MNKRIVLASVSLIVLFTPIIVFAASGDLDRSYGAGGFVHSADADSATVLAIQTDDKVIAGGQCTVAGKLHFCLTRYLVSGAIDPSFGTAGRVATVIGAGDSVISRLIVQPNGYILAVGYTDFAPNGPFGSHTYQFAIARYSSSGSLDPTFDGDGIVTNPIGGQVGAIAFDTALQPDGKFVVVGNGAVAQGTFLAVRFNSDGSLDQSFAAGGIMATTVAGGSGGASVVALQPDGKAVIGGLGSNISKTVFIRLTVNGEIDPTFAGGALVLDETANLNKHLRRMTVLPDGKILVFGDLRPQSTFYLAFYRINPNGTFDTTFDGDGRLLSSVVPDYYCTADDLAIQPNGKLVVSLNGTINGNGYSISARFRADGVLDKQFGSNGAVIRETTFQGSGVVVQSDGKIVQGGTMFNNYPNGYHFFLARYLNNGTRDSDFNGDRKSDLSVFRPSLGTWYLFDGGSGFSSIPFGAADDRIVPADYDGDGRIDVAVFRNGVWYLLNSSNGALASYSFGQSGDVPVPADYDGDDRADIAVFRQGFWYIINSGDNSFRAEKFGQAGDRPVIGNFDGDRRSDLAVYRGGTWYVNGSTTGFSATPFGLATDQPVVGDYDSDGKSDFAVYRDGDWYILGSFLGFSATHFGIASDRPAPGEYDGDGRTDFAVFRDGTWFTLGSLGAFNYTHFGSAGDIPVPSAYLP